MKRILPALLLAAACAGDDPDGVDAAQATSMTAPCTSEYRLQSPTSLIVQYRAEHASGLAPTELWRVSAVACDEVIEPAPVCPSGFTCTGTPPLPKCAAAATAISTDGTVSAYCGLMQENRDAGGAVTYFSRRAFTTVHFRIE